MIRFKSKILNTDITKCLYKKLKLVWNNENWILGTIYTLKTDEERQYIIEMLDSGEKSHTKISLKALEFRGVVGTPIEVCDCAPADILNWDECTEEEKRKITENYRKRKERESQNKN